MKIIAKNILIITTAHFPYGSANSNLLSLLAIGLHKNNRNVSVLLQYDSVKRSGFFEGVYFKTCGIFKKSTKITRLITQIILGITIPSFEIFKNRKKIDIIITFNNYFHESILIIMIAKLLRIPCVHHQVDFYDWNWYSNNINNVFSRIIKYVSYNLRYNFLNKFNDGIIVISHFLYNHFIDIKVDNKKLFILSHLVEFQNFKNAGELELFNKENIVIGALGPLNEENGITVLLNAFKILCEKKENLRLLLIGGPSKSIEIYKKAARELSIINKIEFSGKIQYKQLEQKLSKCDIFVLSRPLSVYAIAGFPTKLGEYLACKRPIVITDYGDIHFFLKDKYNAMLAVPNSQESLVSKIEYLISNKKHAKVIAERGYNWALKKLEFVKATKRTGVFLDSLLLNK